MLRVDDIAAYAATISSLRSDSSQKRCAFLAPSAPQERISSAQRADFVLPAGQDFVREADFVSPYTLSIYSPANIGKQILYANFFILSNPVQLRCTRTSFNS